jgi:hypothetical protein
MAPPTADAETIRVGQRRPVEFIQFSKIVGAAND